MSCTISQPQILFLTLQVSCPWSQMSPSWNGVLRFTSFGMSLRERQSPPFFSESCIPADKIMSLQLWPNLTSLCACWSGKMARRCSKVKQIYFKFIGICSMLNIWKLTSGGSRACCLPQVKESSIIGCLDNVGRILLSLWMVMNTSIFTPRLGLIICTSFGVANRCRIEP